MKVLHVWDPCAVASTLTKYLRQLGVESEVLMRTRYDPYGQSVGAKPIFGPTPFASLQILSEVRHADIVHIHMKDQLIPVIQRFFKRKPIVMHYHGSDIRERWEERRSLWARADRVLVSTPDLLKDAPPGVEWFPNPVDTDLFHPGGEPGYGACYMEYRATDLAEKLAAENGLALTVYQKGIPWRTMPDVLRRHEALISVRRDHLGRVLLWSMSELEALACGLRVIRPDRMLKGLDQTHHAEEAAARALKIYESLLNGRE